MALWGSLDAANNAPKQTGMTGLGDTPQVTANGQDRKSTRLNSSH